MRTAIIIGIGFALLGACLAAGWFTGGAARARAGLLVFVGLWFVAATANMAVGVVRAGYPFMEELPIFLLIFAVPVIVALFVRTRF
jgi:hypothetical protein